MVLRGIFSAPPVSTAEEFEKLAFSRPGFLSADKLARQGRRAAGAFCMAAAVNAVAEAPVPAAQTPQPKEPATETLWKTQTFESVIALRPCPETGMCGEIRWLNPNDTRITDYFGDPAVKAQRDNGFTIDDVKALCGFTPKMQFAEAAGGHWQGRMEMRGLGMTVNVDAAKVDDNNLKVVFSKGIFSKTETWTRVEPGDSRYPACVKPKATP